MQWKRELEVNEAIDPNDPKLVEFRKRIEKFEDIGHGACFLRDERVAEMIHMQDKAVSFKIIKRNEITSVHDFARRHY